MLTVVSGPFRNPHRQLEMGSADEITSLIADTLRRVECMGMGPVRWDWSSRFTSRMGDANLETNVIRFSRPLWPNASVAERRETVVHEACHLATQELFDDAAWDRDHGPEWRQVMDWAGYPHAEACHLVSRRGAVAIARGVCKCRTHEIRLARARRHMAGRALLRCRRCGEDLTFVLEDL